MKDDTSFFGRLLSTGIAELPNGLAEARDAMERVGESVTVEMEKKISMLAVLGTLGPMIGLLGTLKGMIASFSVIALSDTQLKASQVAGGISEALLLTFEGVALSVPAIYFYAVFRNRVSTHFGGHQPAGRRVPAAFCPGRPRQVAPRCRRGRPRSRRSSCMSGSQYHDASAEPNLTPMLDMVFQLVTFFMLVINFKSAQLDMNLKLPVVGSARPVDTKGNWICWC